MIHSCFFCFVLFSDRCLWVPCLSWTVKLPAVLQKNPSGPTNSLVFQHFCAFEPFPTMTIWFWDPSFHTEDNRGTHHLATIIEGSNEPSSRRKNHALRARGWKLLNRMEMCTFFLFCLNIIFFLLVLPFRSYRRYLHVFQDEQKISRQFNCSGQTRDSWKKKKQLIIQVTTLY